MTATEVNFDMRLTSCETQEPYRHETLRIYADQKEHVQFDISSQYSGTRILCFASAILITNSTLRSRSS